jgi:transcriptional regulator with XRE-family HTH domain
MTTSTTTSPSGDIREQREQAGISRAQLAALVGCSLSQLANIEQGAVPKRSRVLQLAWATLARLNDESPVGEPGSRENSARQGRHGSG